MSDNRTPWNRMVRLLRDLTSFADVDELDLHSREALQSMARDAKNLLQHPDEMRATAPRVKR